MTERYATGEMLLSKVIDTNDVGALKRFNVEAEHFATKKEREAYRYILDYAEMNRGQAPSLGDYTDATGAEYIAESTDSFEWMTTQLKKKAAKRMAQDFIESDFSALFNSESDGIKLAEALRDGMDQIIMGTSVRNTVGVNVKKAGEAFVSELKSRKAGESFKIWTSAFPTINREIGGYLSGNMYTWYGRSGRGKSIFTLVEAIEAAMQGARVLIWSLEMSRFEVLARLLSMVSARYGAAGVKQIDGLDYEVGFENRAMLMGDVSDETIDLVEQMWNRMSELIPGEITVRAVDDEDFYQRGVRHLEADILATKADVVVVDPAYYMDYEANTSKTAGGDAAATSKAIRKLCGYTKAAIHVITQADEVKDDTNEAGDRELKPAKRAEIKKTKALLEDCASSFGIDSVDSLAAIELGKGRNGGEGTMVEVIYLPNYGIVQEVAIEPDQFKEEVADEKLPF